MKQNKFIILSTVHNKGNWVKFNVNSIKQQNYTNYLAIYGYDTSTDNSLVNLKNAILNDDKFIIYENPNPGCFLNCFMATYNYLKLNNLISDDDIIVEVDGDDWLLHSFVLHYLNQIYQNNDIWMTYGQYIQYPSGEFGGHYYLYLDDMVDKSNSYRTNIFPYSHLKTYKAFLLNNITKSDLIDPITGNYFNAAADFALCMPLVEMAGKSRIFRVNEPLYVYNTSFELESESNNRIELQKNIEMRIRQIKPKKRL